MVFLTTTEKETESASTEPSPSPLSTDLSEEVLSGYAVGTAGGSSPLAHGPVGPAIGPVRPQQAQTPGTTHIEPDGRGQIKRDQIAVNSS